MGFQLNQKNRKAMKYLLLLLILLSGTAYSQGLKEKPKRTASVEALIDSAVRLETIKISLLHLTTAYEFKSKEADDLRESLRLSELQNTVQKTKYESQLADKPKQPGKWKTFWRGFEIGFGTAAVVTVTLIAL